MAESGSPRRSSDSDDEYGLILSSALSPEVSKEVRLSWLSLEMEVLPYHFEPDLPVPISMIALYPSTVSPQIKTLYVDRVGNTDW